MTQGPVTGSDIPAIEREGEMELRKKNMILFDYTEEPGGKIYVTIREEIPKN
jgi:hypothetical protein